MPSDSYVQVFPAASLSNFLINLSPPREILGVSPKAAAVSTTSFLTLASLAFFSAADVGNKMRS